jgi:hypothetical protein
MSARGVYGLGWINTRVWDETHDPEKSQGWCPRSSTTTATARSALDHENEQPADPKLDRMLSPGPPPAPAAISSRSVPVDGSVWYHTTDLIPGRIVRMEVGTHPPETCIAEVYEPPFSVKDQEGYGPQGIDVDSKGVVWVASPAAGSWPALTGASAR